jgi:hypothetical protein
MESTTMTVARMKPHILQYGSAIGNATGLSLSYSCARISESSADAKLNASVLDATKLLHALTTLNHLDLFLDFREESPHSNPQTIIYRY